MIELMKAFPGVSFGTGVQVCGVANTAIGTGSCIGDGAWINTCIRDEKIRLVLGKCVLIGRRGVINTAGFLEIGDYCTFGPNVYVGDADHDYTHIEVPLLMGGATANRKMVVEENCWFAMNSVISGNLTVGRGSVVGANSVVKRDVPPFSVVAGNPAKVVKMYDPVRKGWVSVRTDEDKATILANREKAGIYSREEYRTLLDRAGLEKIDPIVAGNGINI